MIPLFVTLCTFAGLFEQSHMQYEVDRVKQEPPTEPSLAEMTEKAIRVLQRNSKGYFLFVEGMASAELDPHADISLHDKYTAENNVSLCQSLENDHEVMWPLVFINSVHVTNIRPKLTKVWYFQEVHE